MGIAELIYTSLIRISALNPKFWHYLTFATPKVVPWPGRVRNPNVNGWLIFQRNKLKVTSAWVARGEDCLGYPRPYKRGFKLTYCHSVILERKKAKPTL